MTKEEYLKSLELALIEAKVDNYNEIVEKYRKRFELAALAKKLNLDAIHDTVHEMARDEARHGKAFEGLLNRYFKG